MAAILALGGDAALSHRAAMAHLELGAWTGLPELTTPRCLHRRRGLIIHKASLPPDEVTFRSNIPVTKPSRTLLDLAAVLDERGLRRALNEAAYLGLPLSPSLPELIERHPRRRGVAALKAILAEGRVGLEITRSEFEAQFLELLRERGFPPPLLNHTVTVGDDRFVLDVAWPEHHLAVELDGAGAHGHRAAIERDKRRDRRLRAAGWSVIRVTWRAFTVDRDEVEADLWAALER